jgi:hypothetical protein
MDKLILQHSCTDCVAVFLCVFWGDIEGVGVNVKTNLVMTIFPILVCVLIAQLQELRCCSGCACVEPSTRPRTGVT